MSVARVQTSAFAARKGATLACHRCKRDIPKGEVYRWWFVGFRSRFKHVRCMTCPAPRTSELESSQKSSAYAAVEAGQDALDSMTEPGDVSDLEQVLADAAEGIGEVVDIYREADEAFGGQGATQSAEMADELESAKDELEQWSGEDYDDQEPACDRHANDSEGVARPEMCEDCARIQEEAKQTWWGEQVASARDALDSVGF